MMGFKCVLYHNIFFISRHFAVNLKEARSQINNSTSREISICIRSCIRMAHTQHIAFQGTRYTKRGEVNWTFRACFNGYISLASNDNYIIINVFKYVQEHTLDLYNTPDPNGSLFSNSSTIANLAR